MYRIPRKARAARWRPAAVALTIASLAGCATTANVQQIDRLESVGENPRIVLMPPDVRYYLLTASGVSEPNAEWTEAAQRNFVAATLDYAASIGADVKRVDRDNVGPVETTYDRLHSAVGLTLLQHHFGMTKLPSKEGRFDWSLGPGVSELGRLYDADYAMFVYYRDYQASGGRVAFAIFAAAAGYGVPMGSEHGFASLVDLESGDIVWFNVVNAGQGELRNREGAAATVRTLFRDLPTATGPAATE